MRLAFVIQRYGRDIAGGAEHHCRKVVGLLRDAHAIEVLTTTARNYQTWVGPDAFPRGLDQEDGVAIRRFPVEKPRRPRLFVWLNRAIHRLPHTTAHEAGWVRAQGPFAPGLVRYIQDHRNDYDLFVFYCFRYYPTLTGARSVPRRSLLVPTAEDDWTLRLGIYRPLFEQARGLLFLTPEEQRLVASVADISSVRQTIIGCGVDPEILDFPPLDGESASLPGPEALYVGRVDENKGCRRMLDFFQRYLRDHPHSPVRLTLVGQVALPIPAHARIEARGFVSEAEKRRALRDCRLLIMPSPYESLSLVTIEALGAGRPVLANGRCDVLAGHCRRSQAGRTYHDYAGFRDGLTALLEDDALWRTLSANGRHHVRENYTWPVVRDRCDAFIGQFDRDADGADGSPPPS